MLSRLWVEALRYASTESKNEEVGVTEQEDGNEKGPQFIAPLRTSETFSRIQFEAQERMIERRLSDI